LKIIGKGAHMFQKSVFKTSNADYNRSRHIVNLKELRNLNYQNEDYYIPYNVIKLANDIFTKIREANYVFRKDHKKGVIAACLYYACYMSGIARTPQYISEFVGVEEKFLSQGDRILHDLNEKGVIEIPKKIIPIQQYTYMYFELLDIDKKFIPFVNALIQHAEKSKMHLLHDSKNNTKCIGAIYVLVQRFPKMKEEISIERIEKVCKISKTTVNRYSKMVFKYVNIFKVIFKRYRIPMPNKWRDGVEKKQTRTRKKRLF
jgi:transcription initiation factor TFIIIB Brf1 subunit/transcription initiation factor TFIIB